MLPTEELFVYVYVLVHDLILAGAIQIPRRPGPVPACTDAELLTIAEVRHLLGRRGEAGFLAEVARDWAHLFPVLPHQSEANRRTRWLWGAFEQLRAILAARLPEDDCQQVDTSALPVKHPSRVRGPDQWTGPGNDLAARFGRDAAHAEWFYGFRLAVKTDLGSRIVRAWAIVPAAVSECDVAGYLLEAGPAPRDLLADKGINGAAFAAAQAARGTAVLVPPGKKGRAAVPSILLRVIAEWRNRVETTFSEITVLMELARYGAHTFWGLLTRTAATIAAHTLLRVCLRGWDPCPSVPETTRNTQVTRLGVPIDLTWQTALDFRHCDNPIFLDDGCPIDMTNAEAPLLEARGLFAGYGDLAAVRDLNLTVSAGEIVALLGPNGAGKTTTLLTLAGALPPIKGTVRWNDRDLSMPLHRRVRAGMGFIPEERSVISKLTVKENLRLGEGSVDDAVALFPQLEPLLGRLGGLLSGGEQQMLTLARCLASRPSIMLVDELSLGLAPIVVKSLLATLRTAAVEAGTAVLMVEQQVERALKVADRWYLLRHGSLVASGVTSGTTSSDLAKAYL